MNDTFADICDRWTYDDLQTALDTLDAIEAAESFARAAHEK